MNTFELRPEQFALACQLVAAVLGDGYLEDEYNQLDNECKDEELQTHPYALAVRFAETIESMENYHD